MKKNATTASMWNLTLAFAPNTTADCMKNWLKWMISVMSGANHPIKPIAYSTSKPFSIMLFLRISMAFIVSGPETLLIILLFSLNLPTK